MESLLCTKVANTLRNLVTIYIISNIPFLFPDKVLGSLICEKEVLIVLRS